MENKTKDKDHDKTNVFRAEKIGVKKTTVNKDQMRSNKQYDTDEKTLYGSVSIRSDLMKDYAGKKVFEAGMKNNNVSAGIIMFKSGTELPLGDTTIITINIKDPATGLNETFKLKKPNFCVAGTSQTEDDKV